MSIEMDPTIINKSPPTVLDWVLLSLESFVQQLVRERAREGGRKREQREEGEESTVNFT